MSQAGHEAAAQEHSNLATIHAGQVAFELLMNALRLPEGVPVALFEERAGQAVCAIEQGLHAARARGWLADEPGVLRPTASGLEVLNRLLGLFC